MAAERPNIETDPEQIAALAFDYLRSVFPGWEPADGDAMTALIRSLARQVAEERDIADDVPFEQILRPLGEKVHRIPPIAAAAATATARFEMVDTLGYTVPAGTEILLRTTGDDGVTFATVEPATVAPTVDPPTVEVAVTAMPGREGMAGNGLTGPAVTVRTFDFVETVELVGVSSGGRDAETDQAYLDRLAAELALTSPLPVLPADFAQLALRVPSVARALALNVTQQVDEIISVTGSSGTAAGTLTDRTSGLTVTLTAAMTASALSAAFVARGYAVTSATGGPLGTAAIVVALRGRAGYGPWQVGTTVSGQSITFTRTQVGGDTSPVPRAVTVAVHDVNGAALGAGAKTDVKTLLESMREANFLVSVIDPTYTAIDVTFTAVTRPGWDAATVKAAGEAALAAYLSPATWAAPAEGETIGWVDRPTVRYLEVASVLDRVAGLDYLTDLRVGLEGRTLGTSDVTLTGPAALPRPGAGIRGTVTEG